MSKEQSSRSPEFDAKRLKPLMRHTEDFTSQATDYVLTLHNHQPIIDHINTTTIPGVQKTQRQMNLLNTRVNDAVQELDAFEGAVLPLLHQKCLQLERTFEQIDNLTNLINDIEITVKHFEERCDELEAYQGASASKMKSVGMFFKGFVKEETKKPTLPNPDCVESLPNFKKYINDEGSAVQ